jgi:hypothetical protein
MVRLNPWSLSASRNALTSSSKTSFVTRVLCGKMSNLLTGQSARSLHATPDATLTMIARSNVSTSTMTATAIVPMMMNIKWQSALVSSAPTIVIGRKNVMTISLKS